MKTPSQAAWRGLKLFASSDSTRFKENTVTKSEYEEEGQRVFAKFVL